MEVLFRGTYDKRMFLEALKLSEKRSALNTFFRYLALALSLVIIAGTLYSWLVEGVDPTKAGRLIRGLITAALLGYFYFSAIISRNRSVANLFKSGPKRTMQGSVNLEGVTIGTAPQGVLLDWNRFMSKGEKGPLLSLMTVDGSVAVFHRDFFGSESDWQRFRQLVNQKVIEPK